MPSGHYGRGARGEKGVYRHPDCFNVTGDSDGANLATLGERLVYKYFPSLHAIYDALFARGNLRLTVYVEDAIRDCEPGLDSLLEGARASTRWATREVGLAPLLFFRPIPGFEPSVSSYAPSQALWQRARDELRTAAHKRQLAQAADSDEAMRILTIAVAGVCSQQLANQTGAGFEVGLFTSLTDEVLDMFVNHYSPPGRKARR